MKGRFKKQAMVVDNWSALVFYTLLSFMMLSCSNETTYEDALQENENKIDDRERLDDAKFLVTEKSLNILQLRLIVLASSTGYSSSVVNFGKTHVRLFDEMEKDIDRIAKDEGFKLPTEMSNEHQSILEQIENSTRAQFDRQLILALKEINASQKKMYISKASEGSDPDVRAFAARKIGSIRSLEQSLHDVEKGLLNVEGSK